MVEWEWREPPVWAAGVRGRKRLQLIREPREQEKRAFMVRVSVPDQICRISRRKDSVKRWSRARKREPLLRRNHRYADVFL
jgi:hypothetical protein